MSMKSMLQHLLQDQPGHLELRWHRRQSTVLVAQKGRVDVARRSLSEGVGVRTLLDGSWGFAATADTGEAAIRRAIAQAQSNAGELARRRGKRRLELARAQLAHGDSLSAGFEELQGMTLGDKLGQLVDLERQLARASQHMHSAQASYTEYCDEKAIVSSDGACCALRAAQAELLLWAVAQKDGQQASAGRGAGVSTGWRSLLEHPTLVQAVDEVAALAVDLLAAPHAPAGRKRVILAPSLVGLLCHEAVGHTVEADLVQAGSVAAGKLGEMVASPLVTLADTGGAGPAPGAAGCLPFDDEGVAASETVIIREGRLQAYLHDRESAAAFGAAPAGNARAWHYADPPLIRMRNTYLAPGRDSLEDMIAGVEDGYLVEGAGNGQADTNGEFMFGCTHLWELKKGRKGRLLQGASLSGLAFDVLRSIDAVSTEFRWDLGVGHCGKGQPAKVDAGGPYVRCEVNVGGRAA